MWTKFGKFFDFALARGGWPERIIGATALLGCVIMSPAILGRLEYLVPFLVCLNLFLVVYCIAAIEGIMEELKIEKSKKDI